MEAHRSVWLILLSVVATSVVFVCAISFGPAVIGTLSPQAALAEELPPEVSTADIQATGTFHALSIPPAAFSPISEGTDYHNGLTWLGLHSGSGTFGAPVYLPQGAKVVKLVAFCYDNSGSYSMLVTLNRAIQNKPLFDLMALVSSSDSAEEQKLVDNTILRPIINNGSYSYFVEVDMTGPGLNLNTVKVVYYY